MFCLSPSQEHGHHECTDQPNAMRSDDGVDSTQYKPLWETKEEKSVRKDGSKEKSVVGFVQPPSSQ